MFFVEVIGEFFGKLGDVSSFLTEGEPGVFADSFPADVHAFLFFLLQFFLDDFPLFFFCIIPLCDPVDDGLAEGHDHYVEEDQEIVSGDPHHVRPCQVQVGEIRYQLFYPVNEVE